jgi:hypothetical protein
MNPTAAVPDEEESPSLRPGAPTADERPPAPVATVLLVLLVLAATVAIAYFAFGDRPAAGEDVIRYEAPAAGGSAVPGRRP